jgi:hypothetical protein
MPKQEPSAGFQQLGLLQQLRQAGGAVLYPAGGQGVLHWLSASPADLEGAAGGTAVSPGRPELSHVSISFSFFLNLRNYHDSKWVVEAKTEKLPL